MADKREYPRIECRLEAGFISNGNFFRDILVNLSEGGAQLEVFSFDRLGKDVLIDLRVGTGTLKALGDIKWKDPERRRAGVQFLYLPPVTISCIRELDNK